MVYDIVDFFIKKSFFVLFHAVFKEIISVILCHGREFLTDQTDMFTFPVRFGDPIKKNRQKFLKDNVHSIVFFPLAISKCKSTFACIVWEEIKVISCPVRESGKKFLLYSLPCSHINRNSEKFSRCLHFEPGRKYPSTDFSIQQNAGREKYLFAEGSDEILYFRW